MRQALSISPVGPSTVVPPPPVLGSTRVLLPASRSAMTMFIESFTAVAAPVALLSPMLFAESQTKVPVVPLSAPLAMSGLGRRI